MGFSGGATVVVVLRSVKSGAVIGLFLGRGK